MIPRLKWMVPSIIIVAPNVKNVVITIILPIIPIDNICLICLARLSDYSGKLHES